MKNKKPQFKNGLLDIPKLKKEILIIHVTNHITKKYISLAARSFAHVADS